MTEAEFNHHASRMQEQIDSLTTYAEASRVIIVEMHACLNITMKALAAALAALGAVSSGQDDSISARLAAMADGVTTTDLLEAHETLLKGNGARNAELGIT